MNPNPLFNHSTRLVCIIKNLSIIFFISLSLPQALHAASATLTWNPNNELDLAGYRIYQRTLPSTDYGLPIFSGLPSNPSAPQLTVPNLLEGASYGFIATAFDSAGNESAPSLEKQTTVAILKDSEPPNIEEPTLLETTGETNTPIPEPVTAATSMKESTTTTQEESVESNTTVGAIPPSEQEYLEDKITEKAHGHLKEKTQKNHPRSDKKTKKKRDRSGKKIKRSAHSD